MAHPVMFSDDDPGLADPRSIALALPGAQEKISHGRPTFRANKVYHAPDRRARRPDLVGCISMAVFRTTFPVAASAETVRGILVDFERWSEWNPSVPSISGEARLGGTLAMTLAMPRRPSAKVKAEITQLDPERRFNWHGTVGGDRFFAGDREFEIDAQPDDTVLVTHVETVTGVFFPVFRAVMGSAIQEHHDNLNAALKERAEKMGS